MVEVRRVRFLGRVVGVFVVRQGQIPRERILECIVDDFEMAELFVSDTSEFGAEQINVEGYVDCAEKGRTDNCQVAGENVDVVYLWPS